MCNAYHYCNRPSRLSCAGNNASADNSYVTTHQRNRYRSCMLCKSHNIPSKTPNVNIFVFCFYILVLIVWTADVEIHIYFCVSEIDIRGFCGLINLIRFSALPVVVCVYIYIYICKPSRSIKCTRLMCSKFGWIVIYYSHARRGDGMRL